MEYLEGNFNMIENFILTNTVTGVSLDFNMVTGPIWLESLNIGPVNGIDQLYGNPGQDGEQLAHTSLGTRSVTITAWITEGEPSLREQKLQLNRFCNPKEPLDILVNDYKLTFVPGVSIQYAKDKKENNEVMCKFVITGEAYNPFWTSQEEIGSLVSYVDPRWILPFAIPNEGLVFSVNQPVASTQIRNNDLSVGCEIVFTSWGGSVVNPGIACAETQERLRLKTSISEGEKIVVDTRLGHRKITKYDTEGEASNGMRFFDPTSDWLSLQSGINTISFFADSGSDFLGVSIMYSPLLLEVES